jgi:hypothetical protein
MHQPKGQNLLLNGWFRQGHGHACLPLGLVLKQLLQIEGNSGKQHRFVGAAAAPRIHAPQAVVLE